LLHASCHCGAVHLEIEGELTEVTDCNCSICRRYGALWAYFPVTQVRLTPEEGGADLYLWGDKDIEFHRCKACGCVTHWSPIDKTRNRMGVNARLLEPDELAKARVRKLDGAVTWRYADD
jgi:hypothetical protein